MLGMLSIALSAAASLSCGHITVKNTEVCGDLGSLGAHCANTLNDTTRDISKVDWDEERVGMLCMTSTAFTDTETAIDQFCTAYNLCDYQTANSIAWARYRINKVVQRARFAKEK